MDTAGRNEATLVQAVRLEEGPCPACGSPNVMAVQMMMDAKPVAVRYCGACETREWHQDGQPVDLHELLPAMRATTNRKHAS